MLRSYYYYVIALYLVERVTLSSLVFKLLLVLVKKKRFWADII